MRKFFSFFAALLFAGSMMAETYNKTAYADLKTGDEVIITMENASGIFAASNDKGTSAAPVATAVTVTDNAITTDATNILWTIAKDGDNISFYVGEAALYCTNTNNGMRVGSNANNVFSIDATSGYLYNNATSRFIGVYNNQDWRCYTSVNTNIQGQTLAFFVKASGTTPVDPTPEPATTVYDWAGNVGTTVLGGNSNIAVATVKIHTNADEVASLKFGSSYVYADGKWVAIKPAEGAFKAGDTIKTSVVFNNSDDTKYCMVDAYAADGSTRIWRTDSATTINGRTSAADPAIQTYVLEADQDSIFLGRYGNTTMMVTLLQVVRPAGVTPVEPATEPAAAPDAPTVPANQVKAVYSATYNADCNFGEWGSGTAYTQETVGKKYVTSNLGYFGLEFTALNCAKMEKLHMDVWVAADASIRIVPIWGGAEQGITKNLVGQQWNSVEIALTELDQVTDWTGVYQIKIDNASNLTFWLNNIYFYTTVAPAADTEAPTAVAASLVSASYFSAKISATATDNSDAVIFVVKDGENELATAPAVSGVAKEITVNGLLPNTAYNFSVIAKDEAGNAADPVAVVATTLAAPAPATAPTYAADKVLAIYTDVYTNVKFDIQDWWAMPAVSEGNLTATSKALCLEPNTTPSSCFGLAFAAVDASAYDALEMDVYATTEGSVLNTQAIGIGEAQTFNLVAGQWNHIVLNIKGNTKADLQQVGFYDCHNLTGVVFIQNVLFVDTDAPVVSAISLTQFIADKPATEVELKDLTVIYATGKNTYVIDEDGVALVMYDANKTYYDGTLTAGKVLSGQKATYTSYNNQDEIIPTNAVVATDGTAPVPVLMAAAPTAEANVNQYLRFENVAATETSGKYYIYENVQLYGASADLKPTEAGNYNVEGIFINYKGNTPELIVTAIEKAGGVTPVEGDTIDVTINAITTPGALVWTDAVASAGWWQIMGATEDYEFSLSNVSTTEVAGVYAIADLDPDYSYITVMTATDTTDVTFVDGSVTVAVANDGTVTIVGALVGDDGNVYNFNLTYADPKAERVANVTISNGTLYDGYAAYGLYAVYGTADDNTAYVQLAIWTEAGFEGEFTEEDLDLQYIGSGVQDTEGSHSIFSAAITVTPGNGEGVYSITADLLCYNNTLYKVTMSIGDTEGFESVDAAVKAVKMLINGNVVIEKAGKRYNVNGAVIR